jgi:four helix bundle protein
MYAAPSTGRPENLASRAKRFAVAIVRFYVELPKSNVNFVLGRQLLRAGTSVGAQYREARRAKSNADFISKMEGALQELDETTYWLEVLHEAGLAGGEKVAGLAVEANELISIFVSAMKRAKLTPPGEV